MLDKQFDDIIKNKLTDWKHQSKPDWNAFVEKRDNRIDQVLDEKLDEIIRQKVQSYSSSPAPSGWHLLKAKYDQIQAQKGKVIFIKSLELFILLLLMIPLSNRISTYNHHSNSVDLVQSNTITDETQHSSQITSNIVKGKSNSINSESVLEDIETVVKQSSILNTVLSKVEFGTENVQVANENKISNSRDGAALSSETISDDEGINTIFTDEATHYGIDIPVANSLARNIDHVAGIAEVKISLNPGIRDIAVDFSELTGSQEVNPKYKSKWLCFSGAIQNNIINSPMDVVYGIHAHQNFAPGYRLSLNYGQSFGRFDLVAGLGYSRTSYEPYPITETYEGENGIHILSLKEISLESISLPVEIQYHVLVKPEWSVYLRGGITTNLLWNESYMIEDKLDIPLPRPPGTEIDPNQALLYSKPFSKGFKGDLSFKEALYVNGHVGLGIERMVSSKIKLFMSGYYSHQFSNRLGPNADRINLAGFETGLKLRI